MEKLLELSLGQLLWSSAGVFLLLSLFIEITPVKLIPFLLSPNGSAESKRRAARRR